MESTTPAFAVSLTTRDHFSLHGTEREAQEQLAQLTGVDADLQHAIITGLRSRGSLYQHADRLVRAHLGDFQIEQTEIPTAYLLGECADNPLARR